MNRRRKITLQNPSYLFVEREQRDVAAGSETTFQSILPNGVRNGDLLIVALRLDFNVSTVTPPSGWTAINVAFLGGTTAFVAAYWKVYAGGPLVEGWTLDVAPTNTGYVSLLVIRGADQVSPSGGNAVTNNDPSSGVIVPPAASISSLPYLHLGVAGTVSLVKNITGGVINPTRLFGANHSQSSRIIWGLQRDVDPNLAPNYNINISAAGGGQGIIGVAVRMQHGQYRRIGPGYSNKRN